MMERFRALVAAGLQPCGPSGGLKPAAYEYGVLCILLLVLSMSCGAPSAPPSARPSILLVTLDTTRADAIGPDATGVSTPAFNAIAAKGRRFRQAYATVPETLPSHASIMTGLYPAGHAVHENGRFLAASHTVLAERLKQAGYVTAAYVSAFPLARRFGLARGFDTYDDQLPPGREERSAKETTSAATLMLGATAGLAGPAPRPLFLWVHYYDAHAPYAPPEPFRTEYAGKPYLGEIAAMDEQLGALVQAFERTANGPVAIVIASDHGEGLGDHGESQHGNLLYQSTMHVPLVVMGPGVGAGVSDTPVSTRRIFNTILDWAGVDSAHSLRDGPNVGEKEVVLGEAMKPFLEYGWQPQVMSVGGRHKAILTARVEGYDVIADPAETHPIDEGSIPAEIRKAGLDYPVPSIDVSIAPASLGAAKAPAALSDEDRRRLASLGYVSGGAAPAVRKNAPRPADMVRLFDVIEQASGLFVNERYAEVIPLLEKIRAEDPFNLDATLRLAVAQSALGHDVKAVAMFDKAAELSPQSPDVRLYRALHYARGKDWARAVPTLERIVSETPDRLAAVEALSAIRVRRGQLAMAGQNTAAAIAAFEDARRLQPAAFRNDLELGVLYLSARRFVDARDALDRVPASHPDYSMALFKRAQVSVLLREPDASRRIALAREKANSTTRPLIEKEKLFQSIR